jgi:hypothetical protein
MPHYVGMGRAIFERGNGFAYPNAYDYRDDAPVIYFHWFIWLLGFGVVKLGFEPGAWFVTLGVVGAVACSWVTLKLVEAILPTRRFLTLLFLLAMWGGGFLCLARIAANIHAGRPWSDDICAYDPFDGYWFMNWGRNLIYPTEATYHALAAACWLAVLRGRWPWAVAAAAAVAATHPFSGLEVFLMLLAWWGLEFCLRPDRRHAVPLLALVVVIGLFGWYYGVYLESFPQHRHLRNALELNWTLSPLALVLGIGPVALFTLARLIVDRRALDKDVGFLLTCFAVAFLLSNHQWFIHPVQPLHYTRGYFWLPLCLIGLPWGQRVLSNWRQRMRPVVFAATTALMGAVAVSDNALFLRKNIDNPEHVVYLWPAADDMFRWIKQNRLQGVLLTRFPDLGYWASVYTSLRPFTGHGHSTPDYNLRLGELDLFFDRGQWRPWLPDVDYIVIGKKHLDATRKILTRTDSRTWRPIYQNQDLVLLEAEEATSHSQQGSN